MTLLELELLEHHLLEVRRSSKNGVMPQSFYDALRDCKMLIALIGKEVVL